MRYSLNLPDFDFAYQMVGETQMIFDPIRQVYVKLTPEEWVRQNLVQYLIHDRGYPRGLIAVEKSFLYQGMPRRADVVAYGRSGTPLLLAECKAPEIRVSQRTFDQVALYNAVLKARHLVVTNGLQHYCCQVDHEAGTCVFLDMIPAYGRGDNTQ